MTPRGRAMRLASLVAAASAVTVDLAGPQLRSAVLHGLQERVAEAFAEKLQNDLAHLHAANVDLDDVQQMVDSHHQHARTKAASDPGVDPRTGIWTSRPGMFDNACMSRALVAFFTQPTKGGPPASVTDLGAGDGHYTRHLKDAGIVAQCFDGYPNETALTGGLCTTKDVSQPLEGVTPTTWALSLEVGEHIPKDKEQTFLDNVVAAGKDGAVLSWALPGQEGDGHVNLQPNSYVEAQMQQRGMALDQASTDWLRAQLADEAACGSYFKNTVMAFRRT